ncbi:MAG TPA: NUDIX hydrolase [Alphaproteobacteria bacterium]|nr:NUDIX hydrolase [Alphaproteobacteria bacterium]
MSDSYVNGIEIGVVSLVLNDTNDKILLGLSKENRGWTLPGGHLEPGETLEQSIIRETKEEVQIEIDVLKILDVTELIYTRDNGDKRHVLIFPFVTKIKSGQIIKPDNIEFSEVKWANFDDAENILNKHYKKTIPMLKKWLQEKK